MANVNTEAATALACRAVSSQGAHAMPKAPSLQLTQVHCGPAVQQGVQGSQCATVCRRHERRQAVVAPAVGAEGRLQ